MEKIISLNNGCIYILNNSNFEKLKEIISALERKNHLSKINKIKSMSIQEFNYLRHNCDLNYNYVNVNSNSNSNKTVSNNYNVNTFKDNISTIKSMSLYDKLQEFIKSKII